MLRNIENDKDAQSCYDFSPVNLDAKLDLCCERNIHLQLQNLRYGECAFDCLTAKAGEERKGQRSQLNRTQVKLVSIHQNQRFWRNRAL